METQTTQKNALLSWIFWINKKLRDKEPKRYLKVTSEGYFYLFITVALGVAALVSGNNLLYLLDSILLTTLALSGIASDRTIRGIQMEISLNQAYADETTYDDIRVYNTRRYPLFLIHIDEITHYGNQRVAIISHIPGKSVLRIPSLSKYPERGRVEIHGYSIGSFFPFGLAEKKFPIKKRLSRIVWPKRAKITEMKSEKPSEPNSVKIGEFLTEGEVHPLSLGSDSRHVVWTLSSKFEDEWYTRPRRTPHEKIEIYLDVEKLKDKELEKKISEIASIYYSNDFHKREIKLTILSKNSEVTFTEKNAALNALSLIQKKEKKIE
jgi:hypothetical protein